MSLVPRSKSQLELMRKSGLVTAKALKAVLEAIKPGISLLELEKIANSEITKLGAQPSFKTVPGYSWATCLTVNNEVVHGIPRPITLKEGDLFSIDIGAVFGGWHTDAAWSVLVGHESGVKSHEKEKFLKAGEEALWQGIAQARSGNKIGDIVASMQRVVEGVG
ncbi:M24 family metallopeptidase [Candidatus Daviesbacteria bacterium]|nr:M24 family metallopeptidase [Candidatus Daviesbacteria bacterium]